MTSMTSITDGNVKYPLLFFTSGTPINIGQRDCRMERWLGNHAGRHGTGYRKSATAIPLATGSGVHQGLELLGGWILDWQAANPNRRLTSVPDEVTAWAATEAAARYEARARARGLELTKTDLTAAAAVEQLILEQRTLIESQIWIYALGRLPVMLSQARLLAAEHEEGSVLDCTCGLGDWIGDWVMHGARGCAGIVFQSRCDMLWEMFADKSIAYEELKTKATANYGWEQAWEHSGQLFLGMESASRRIGREVGTAFVPVLFKGKRDRVNRDDPTSPKIQQSPLAYGWFHPGGGMNRGPEWAARWEWYDDWGKKHTLGATYKRTPIWDESIELPKGSDQNPNGVAIRADASRVEQWIKGWILPIQYPQFLKVLGPFQKQRVSTPDRVESLLAEERQWADDTRWLRSLGVFQPGDRAKTADGEIIGAASIISRSWNCTKFDGTPCQFKRVCHKEIGWENLDQLVGGDGGYAIRTPHHALEMTAFEAYVKSIGLVFEDPDDEDGGEA